MGLNTASQFLKIAVVLSLLAAIFHAVGFATNSWRVTWTSHQGLWETCVGDLCGKFDTRDSKFLAVRAMETIGLIMVLAVLLVGIVFLCVDNMRRRSIRSFLILGSLLGVVAITIGLIIYGVDYIQNCGLSCKVGYSMALTIVGGILELGAGVTFALDRPR
ncbi:claudin domain-containing protein 2-like [Liolophura sinensis]|uniref:claudin domain-containing protein 2-like n=1 Tax=Liolophura sinensis TaxID=3198878 RepID=UPI003158E8E1